MADQVRWRGGSRENSEKFTGASREVTVDTTLWTLRVHDGITPGGHKLLKAGNCLVVEEADKCDPNLPTCKVTVNGELEVNGELDLNGDFNQEGDMTVDGDVVFKEDLTVEGTTTLDDLHVTGCISNPSNDGCGTDKPVEICDDLHVHGNVIIDGTIDLGDVVLDLYTDDLTLKNPGDYVAACNVPDGNGLKTQYDANSWFYRAIVVLDTELCKAQDDINTIKYDIQKLENDVEANQIAIADLQARVDLLEQAIAILETEIEALAVQVKENSAAIEAIKIAILDLNQEIEEIKDWIKAHSLDEHTDVDLSAPSNGDYFVYKNGKWTNEAQCNMKCNTYIPSLATL